MKLVSAAAAAAVILLAMPSSARAWRCVRPEDGLRNAVAGDDTFGSSVLIGTVTSVTPDNRYAEVAVELTLRGKPADVVEVENASPFGGTIPPGAGDHYGLFAMDVGTRYVLVGHRQDDGPLRVPICAPWGPASEADMGELVSAARSREAAELVRRIDTLNVLGVGLLGASVVWIAADVWRRQAGSTSRGRPASNQHADAP